MIEPITFSSVATVTTAAGQLISSLDLTELRIFGEETHRLEFPSMGAGGFVVSGRQAVPSSIPGKEEKHHGQGRQEAGSGAWARTRPSAQAAAAGSTARSVKLRPEVRRILAELSDYDAPITVVGSSARFAYLSVPVGLFHSLPFRAELLLEMPLVSRQVLRTADGHDSQSVPDVRVWSRWTTGPAPHDGLIRSHHAYPDDSMCVCMHDQWRLGTDSLLTYVDFSVLWIARVLHELLIGYFPGPQHYDEMVRVDRDKPQEYCGCSKLRTYASCCRDADRAMPASERIRRHYAARRVYLEELSRQGRDRMPDVVSAWR